VLRWIDRITITLLTLLSVGLLTLWFRSQTVGDRMRWMEVRQLSDGSVLLESDTLMTGEGGVSFLSDRRHAFDEESATRVRRQADRSQRIAPNGYSRIPDPRYPMRSMSNDSMLALFGIHYGTERRGSWPLEHELVSMTIPLWVPILLTAVYPLVRFVRGVVQRERLERAMLGLCPRCGVNVRNSPDRCPACGKRSPLLPATQFAAPAAAR
jgi:hypothetical protein